MIGRTQAYELAEELADKAWGFVTIHVNKQGVSGVTWHPRQGMGIYQNQLRDAMALAQLHSMEVHVDVVGGQPEIRFMEPTKELV